MGTKTKTTGFDPKKIYVDFNDAELMERCRAVSNQFRQAIEIGVFWSLGVAPSTISMVPGEDNLGGLFFTATILPFRKDGSRGVRARKMDVMISLTGEDLIDIEVRHHSDGTFHAESRGVFIGNLNRRVLALDYDGIEAFNPRYV